MKKTLTILTVLAVMLVAMMGSVCAASVNANVAQAKVGDTVTVSVSTDASLMGVQYDLKYDTSRLKFESDKLPAGVQAHDAGGVITYSYVGTVTKTSPALTFTVIADAPIGTADFSISGTEFTDGNGDIVKEAVASPSTSVEIVAPAEETTPPAESTVKPGPTTSEGNNKGETDNKGTSTEGTGPVGTNGEEIKKLPQTGAPLYMGAIALVVVAGAVVVVRKIRK